MWVCGCWNVGVWVERSAKCLVPGPGAGSCPTWPNPFQDLPPPHTLEDGPIGKHSQVRSFVRNHEECGLLVIPDEGVWRPDSPLAWHLHHLDVSASVLQSRVTPPLPGSLSGSESNVT